MGSDHGVGASPGRRVRCRRLGGVERRPARTIPVLVAVVDPPRPRGHKAGFRLRFSGLGRRPCPASACRAAVRPSSPCGPERRAARRRHGMAYRQDPTSPPPLPRPLQKRCGSRQKRSMRPSRHPTCRTSRRLLAGWTTCWLVHSSLLRCACVCKYFSKPLAFSPNPSPCHEAPVVMTTALRHPSPCVLLACMRSSCLHQVLCPPVPFLFSAQHPHQHHGMSCNQHRLETNIYLGWRRRLLEVLV